MGNSITRLTSLFRVAAGALVTTVDRSHETRPQPTTVAILSKVNLSPQKPTQGGNALKSRSLFIVPARRLNAPKTFSCARDSKGFDVEFPCMKPVEGVERRKHNWKNKPLVKEIGKTQPRRHDSRTTRWSISRQRTSTWEKQFQRREVIQMVDAFTTRSIARKLTRSSPESGASDEGYRQPTPPRERTETTPSRKRQRLDLDNLRESPETSELDHMQEKRAKVPVEVTAAGSVCSPPEFSSLETPPSPPRVVPIMRTFHSVPMPILKRLKHLVRLARRRRRLLNSLEVEWPDLMQIDPLSPTGIDVTMCAEGDQAGVVANFSPYVSMDFGSVDYTQCGAAFTGGDHFDLEMFDVTDEDSQSETELPVINESLYGSIHMDLISGNSFSDIQMLSDSFVVPETASLPPTGNGRTSEKPPVQVKETSEADNGSDDTDLDSEDQCDSDEEGSGHEDGDDSDESSHGDEDIEEGIREESGSELDDLDDDASSEENMKKYTPHPRTPTTTEKMMNMLYGAANDVPDEEELRQLEAEAEDEHQADLFTQYEQLCRETLGCPSDE